MYSRSLLIAFVALFASLAVVYAADATPPACFLACVNEETTVSDYKAVCSSKAMSPCLDSRCATTDLKDAQASFTTHCKSKGYTALITDSKTSSASATKSSAASVSTVVSTRSDGVLTTMVATSSPTATGTSKSGSNSTSAAGPSKDADSAASLSTASFGIVSAFAVGVVALLL